MEKITFKQFKSNLISEPFFVWHTLEDVEDDWDNDFEPEDFWKQDLDYANTSVAQVMMQTYHKIDEKLTEMLVKQNGVILTSSIDERIEETKEFAKTDRILINPAFEYNGAVSTPFAFDFKTNTVINLKYSKKTKRMDFVKAYYDLSIITTNIKVKDYNLYLPVNHRGKKGEINLTHVNEIFLSMSGNDYDKKDIQRKSSLPVKVMDAFKNALSLNGKNEEYKHFDSYIDEINEARNVNTLSDELSKNVTQFGFNPKWDNLLKETNNPFAGISGNIIPKKVIASGEVKKYIDEKFDGETVYGVWKEITEAIIVSDNLVSTVIEKIKKAKRNIWYDFEGYSLPFPAVDDTKAFQQIVFQLSKIETDENISEVEADNFVWDPQNINVDSLYEVLEGVYSEGADNYIVYNKSYENTRLKEIVNLLALNHDPRYKRGQEMLEHIEARTIDLWELFRITNGGKNVPPIMMHDQKCKTSIKNIEKHITANKIPLGYSIKEYKNLDVQNGGMAMDIAIKRATGVIKDNAWEDIVPSLKEYCENDVRMMIMVYYFIEYLKDMKELNGKTS